MRIQLDQKDLAELLKTEGVYQNLYVPSSIICFPINIIANVVSTIYSLETTPISGCDASFLF
jgi:hypothetical protein